MVMMTALPQDALLQPYARRPDCYTDCFSAHLARPVDLSAFITAFYSTRLFAAERVVLKYAAGRPSTRADIDALAAGETDAFAAWSVEAREKDQILLCDMHARTRSWLMVSPASDGTELYFGSAVVPADRESGLGMAFKSLLWGHKIYARALLRAAVKAV